MIARRSRLVSLALSVIAAMTAPAVAQEMTTLQYVIAKGAVAKVDYQGQSIEIVRTYKADGTYTGSSQGQTSNGKWRIDGDKLCQTPGAGRESCVTYPPGKKPGDEFKVQTPQAIEMTIRINP